MEIWKDIPGFEGRYQVSDQGRVKSLPFMQRYLLRNGQEAFRRTGARILAQQLINSGYSLAHLHLDNARTALTVHSLVAQAFLPGPPGETVNHKNGVKTDNRASNLEWTTYSENHLHAVATGLRPDAIPVIAPGGRRFPSINQAQEIYGKAARDFQRA
jgi:CO dehydrogenase/acetyl-CoA synthase alpha subunit